MKAFVNKSLCSWVKLNPTMSVRAALGQITGILRKYDPTQPFDYRFVDAEYAKKFGAEERIGNIAAVF
ncbi:MAG TPA: hypothetical protein VKU83_07580, partial [Puia sp.]|nr:hypothetical protein [Puia sp.]